MKNAFLPLIAAAILFFYPRVSFAQAPNLGSTADFVLFTSSGAVGNTGVSHLTGNVGTNTGSITGFGNVNGVMHIPGAVTLTAKNDLNTVYNQLNSAVASLFPAPLLGNGATLNAAVYSIDGNTTLNLNLTLDAQGNSNAVFIFKIQGTFSANTSSQIILINGAKACNVFWNVEGLVSLADNVKMRGTIIANNAAINISSGATLEGRALSTTGAININGVLAYIPTGCGSPLLTGPDAPFLGSALCFTLFSGTGDVTNDGISNVTGDIGTNDGLTTGFNPLNVNGTIHPIPDGSTGACAFDLLNTYDYLNTLPHDIELLYPAQFGRNLVLTPHTYLMNAATSLTDTLYLNAEGNNSAVFVIKINGALTTSTYSKVLLINGAQAKNVYWKVDGAVSINDYSIFKGTIVSNGAISLTTGVSLTGRALTNVGAFTTFAITAVVPPGDCITLPVTWLSFTAEKNINNSVLLKWSTAGDINNDHFDVQASSDGRNFTSIGSVAAGNDLNPVKNYFYTHAKTMNGNNFYRIKQVDLDGRFTYSVIVKVNITASFWNVFPNPATSKTTIQIQGQMDNLSIALINSTGKTVYQRSMTSATTGEIIDIPLTNFARGIYMLKIQSDQGIKTDKIILQ